MSQSSQNENIQILNSMHVIDSSASGGELEYVFVEYNNSNLDKLRQVIGADFSSYMYHYGDPDGEEELIDISIAGFQYADADYYSCVKDRFISYTKDKLREMLEEEKRKNRELEKRINDLEQ